jgi:hypothetical protein
LIGRHKFSVGKNFEVENFQLLTMTFSENFLSVEIFPAVFEGKFIAEVDLPYGHLLLPYRQ